MPIRVAICRRPRTTVPGIVSIRSPVSESWFLVQSRYLRRPLRQAGATTSDGYRVHPRRYRALRHWHGHAEDATVVYTCAALIGAVWLAVLPVLERAVAPVTVYPTGHRWDRDR